MLEQDFKNNKKSFITLCIILFVCILLYVLKTSLLNPAKVNEEQLYKSIYESARQISDDEDQRKLLANCFLEKMKIKYKGDIENLNLDNDKSLINSISKECAGVITKISWTKEMEQKMLTKFSSMEELKNATTERKNSYAHCVLSELKIKFPDGINGRISQEDMDEIYRSCIDVLK